MSTAVLNSAPFPVRDFPVVPVADAMPYELPVLPGMPGDPPRPVPMPMPQINGDAPLLPDVEGPKATPQALASLFKGDLNDLPINTRALALLALIIFQDSTLRQVIMHERLRRTAELQRNTVKAEEIAATMDKIAGDRLRSFNNFCASLASVAATSIPAYYGNLMCITADGVQMAQGQALVGVSHSLGQLVQNSVMAWDKLAGGGRQVDDAEVRLKVLQREQDILQQLTDSARNMSDTARQEWPKVQQYISEMNERRMQAINMIYR